MFKDGLITGPCGMEPQSVLPQKKMKQTHLTTFAAVCNEHAALSRHCEQLLIYLYRK